MKINAVRRLAYTARTNSTLIYKCLTSARLTQPAPAGTVTGAKAKSWSESTLTATTTGQTSRQSANLTAAAHFSSRYPSQESQNPSASKNGPGSKTSNAKLERFDVLDALRFVLALWVVVAHLGVFPIMGVDLAPGLPHLVARAWNSLVWGMPAVMAFFVISGFCIHYPLHNGREFKPGQFYLRRYTRILIPAAVIVGILYTTSSHFSWSGHGSVFFSGTLWSLLCEEIYYALYPLLRALRNQVGWAPILVTTSVFSIVLANWASPAQDWFDVGPLGTAAILYPVWIAGCMLAEGATTRSHQSSTKRIWGWRAGAWLAMWVSEALNFHLGISQVHTMIFIGFIAALWIREEIAYGRGRATNVWFMKAGAWSYSLYLVHPLVFHGFDVLARVNPATRIGWCIELIVALIGSYLFFIAIERPAHRLAKNMNKITTSLQEKI